MTVVAGRLAAGAASGLELTPTVLPVARTRALSEVVEEGRKRR